MNDRERIQELNQRLRQMEQIDKREVASWQRPILEVAREALLAELSALARSVARWDQLFRKPVMSGESEVDRRFSHKGLHRVREQTTVCGL